MLFSSSYFIFLFLPAVITMFYALRRFAGFLPARGFLILGSLFFYAFWNPTYIFLILGSIAVNLAVARRMCPSASVEHGEKKWLRFGVLFNLALLGYFKYSVFVASSIFSLYSDLPFLMTVTLPLAISFFTFQQIAFLVDSYREPSLVNQTRWDEYMLFVLFFPQLIAGPIVHHKALVPQLRVDHLGATSWRHFELGIAIFLLGLFKKTVIADQLAEYTAPIFDGLARGGDVPSVKAWLGILLYTFRLYFDFSAYSDMAFGLALLFGITLPVNFFSPYKAGNINETWQRWNITLGNFFGNYVYKPLGGNKRGLPTTVRNLMVIMLLSGLWHGAGWNYLLWGVMQGLAMGIGYCWPLLLNRMGLASIRQSFWYAKPFAIGLTFSFWVLSLVAFRVTDLGDLQRFYASLFRLGPSDLVSYAAELSQQLGTVMQALSGNASLQGNTTLASTVALLICLPLVFAAPNTLQYFGVTRNGRIGRAEVTKRQALVVGVAGGLAIASVISSTANEFIYFAF